jgi:hypothetical protein
MWRVFTEAQRMKQLVDDGGPELDSAKLGQTAV